MRCKRGVRLGVGRWAGGGLLLAGLAGLLALGGRPALALAQGEDGASVYKTVLKSTVWIYSKRGNVASSGSGVLVDQPRRLVLTNYHVVSTSDTVSVLFPIFRDGKLVAEREAYLDRLRQGRALRGRVLSVDRERDMAIVQLDDLPSGVQAISLAEEPVSPGQSVHSVGNAGASGALWGYVPGRVRQVYDKRWKSKLDGKILTFAARVVETDSPTNPGDSGGPLVNDKAQLVGLTQGGNLDARNVSIFIDVSEIKSYLNSREIRNLAGGSVASSGSGGSGGSGGTVKGPARAAALPIRDRAKLFGAQALSQANAQIEQLFAKHKLDLLIETYPAPPNDDPERVSKLSASEREAYFRGWMRERMNAEQVRGVGVLICQRPTYLYIDVAEPARSAISPALVKELISTTIGHFKNKDFDTGLSELVRRVSDQLATATPTPTPTPKQSDALPPAPTPTPKQSD